MHKDFKKNLSARFTAQVQVEYRDTGLAEGKNGVAAGWPPPQVVTSAHIEAGRMTTLALV